MAQPNYLCPKPAYPWFTDTTQSHKTICSKEPSVPQDISDNETNLDKNDHEPDTQNDNMVTYGHGDSDGDHDGKDDHSGNEEIAEGNYTSKWYCQ